MHKVNGVITCELFTSYCRYQVSPETGRGIAMTTYCIQRPWTLPSTELYIVNEHLVCHRSIHNHAVINKYNSIHPVVFRSQYDFPLCMCMDPVSMYDVVSVQCKRSISHYSATTLVQHNVMHAVMYI